MSLKLVRVGAVATLVAVSAGTPVWGATPERLVNVLLVYAETRVLPAVMAQDEALRTTLQAGLPRGVFFYTEYLDPTPLPAAEEAALVAILKHKYRNVTIDLVVASTSVGLRFVLSHRARLFPDVPVVFMSVNPAATIDLDLAGNVSGIWQSLDWAGTLDVALRLQPGTRRVAVVTGASQRDQLWLASARDQLTPYRDRLDIQYVPVPSLPELLEKLAGLPADAVVLIGTVHQDATGRALISAEVAERIAAVTPVAAYGLLETHIGAGIVGGRVVSPAEQGKQTGRLALRVLAGEDPGPPAPSASVAVFDWRQLQRWGLDARRLPPGSVVRFRPASVWDTYKWYIAGGAVVLLLQGAFIVTLLASRAQRRRAQRSLAERLEFETLLSEVSTEFLTLPASAVDQTIERMLRRAAETLDFDRAMVASREPATNTMRTRHSWARAGVPLVPTPVAEADTFPWMWERLGHGEAIWLPRLDALPGEAAADRRGLTGRGVRTLAALPLFVDGNVAGALAFSRLRGEREWPEGLIGRLRLLADVFAIGLARQRADDAMRESEERRRRAEEEAQRRRDELAHALRVSTLGELTASIAHEINQPLTAIVTNAQAMLRRLGARQAEPGELEEVLTDITDDGSRISKTVQRLRALFRKAHAERTALDINTLIDDVLGLLRSDLQAKNITVRFTRGKDLPSVLGDPIQLRQVILNLLMNAGEAIAMAEIGPRAIDIETAQHEAGRLAITIRDTGVGVKESDLEKIFEHFVSSKSQGLGMGLAISRSIVEAHGGRIWATPNDGRGLVLNVELFQDKEPAGR